MIPENKVANAVSGKTARACDCCIRRRARWYCPADDAFLCQVCDGSVHSANSLAQRHDRVRLKTASLKRSPNRHNQSTNLPSWHRGFTKKPRTPRQGKSGGGPHQGSSKSSEESHGPNPLRLSLIVPELGLDETTSSQDYESEDQLLYRVPIFDPFGAKLSPSTTTTTITTTTTTSSTTSAPPPVEGFDAVRSTSSHMIKSPQDGYLPPDLDLEQFTADVETLLGKGLDDEESYGIEQLGLLDCVNINNDTPNNNFDTCNYNNNNNNNKNDNDEKIDDLEELAIIKAEDADQSSKLVIEGDSDELGFREPFELSFDYDEHEFPTTCEDQKTAALNVESSSPVVGDYDDEEEERENNKEGVMMKKRKILLRLDYDAISNAWATHGSSPWMNGQRPQISADDCWPHCMGTCGVEMHQPLFVGDHHHQMGGHGVAGDGGREARVSRYREKRRTRLFAKKIRYEVRKLNAEKRPRMKGRFVKRSSFAPASSAFPLRSK